MRLSHLTLLHKGQTSTRYYRWMTRFSTLLILMNTIFSQLCLSQLEFNPFSLIPRSGGWVWVQSYATIVHNRSSHSLHFFIFISNHVSCSWLCQFESKIFTLIGCLDQLYNWRLNWIPFLPAVPHDLTASWRSTMSCLIGSTLTLFWMLNRWSIKTTFTLIFKNRKPNIWGKLWPT